MNDLYSVLETIITSMGSGLPGSIGNLPSNYVGTMTSKGKHNKKTIGKRKRKRKSKDDGLNYIFQSQI